MTSASGNPGERGKVKKGAHLLGGVDFFFWNSPMLYVFL